MTSTHKPSHSDVPSDPRCVHFILYVADQQASTTFYAAVLQAEPTLNVPGMTEFTLPGGAVLGLMPNAGIERLLGIETSGQSRAELYLVVADPQATHNRALAAGATELSPLSQRDWGQRVAYSRDADGHIVAIAG